MCSQTWFYFNLNVSYSIRSKPKFYLLALIALADLAPAYQISSQITLPLAECCLSRLTFSLLSISVVLHLRDPALAIPPPGVLEVFLYRQVPPCPSELTSADSHDNLKDSLPTANRSLSVTWGIVCTVLTTK